jgi:PKD repeat protein
MRKLIQLLGMVSWCLIHPVSHLSSQGVTIGTSNPPDPAAVLDLQSTNSGFLLPRLTTTQRNAISSPPVGLQIFNTTTQCVETYFNGGWRATVCECVAAPSTPSAISGPTDFCVNQTALSYSIAPQADASSYTWSIPAGATLVAGQGTSSITVNMGSQSGVVSVTASNSCGVSSANTLAVNVSTPSASFGPLVGSVNNAVSFNGPVGMSSYAWTFAGGSLSTSSVQNPQVTWTNAGTYAVSLTVTNAIGCTTSLSQSVVISLCQPFSQTFSPCGATGRFGPSQSQCNTAYGPGVVMVSGGIQEWTVPATGTYRIEAAGAEGGRGKQNSTSAYSTGVPGRGAVMIGEFSLNQGTVLRMAIGQRGGEATTSPQKGGGGGGGTFVVLANNTPLVVAGGGGGSGRYNGDNGNGGTTSPSGTAGNGTSGAGGTSGNGGAVHSCSFAGGSGAGFSGNGINKNTGHPLSFLNGATGASISDQWSDGNEGGFGGGGGTGPHGGAGGGGYSGGGGGGDINCGTNGGGGGGGSFNSGSNPSNTSGNHAGTGYVIITRICP